MRLFTIDGDGSFKEYISKPFHASYQESVLETWLESNPDGIVEDGRILIIGRQILTNLGSVIDLLGLDRDGDAVVVELKRDRTPRETLAQSLEYASFVEELGVDQLESILSKYLNDESIKLAEYHRQYFELATDEAVSFNKDQRIVIVGQRVTDEIRQTSNFLRNKGIKVTCIEFSYFESNGGLKLLSHEIVVGGEPKKVAKVSSASLPITSKREFLEALDNCGRPVFEKLLSFAESHQFPLHWGTKGFSANVDIEGTHVAICFGYPPNAVFKQSIYTSLYGKGGLLTKVALTEEEVNGLFAEAKTTGLFRPAGREQKFSIDRPISEDEMNSVLKWLEKVAATVRRHGLQP